ncbi:MAG: beta-Ala-His dipeptidase [Clostridiales bacterium]|nr:beta-Ala-His dipeptidase [Clostridiales bacterium]
MNTEIEALCQNRVFAHFYQICQIPHGSRDEKALSDSITRWARSIGLEAEQDEVYNVLIHKPASPGYEAAPPVLLQAHMDMVCEKAEGVAHDFTKDPIQWVVRGDELSTGGRTTLGADDGIGVALAMAVLEDDTLAHPPLDALFTVCEEEDFTGAERFAPEKLRSARLINLDHTEDNVVVCGSCGGMRADFLRDVDWKPIPTGWTAWRLSVGGLRGGHSGDDIHRGRGNANILLARLLLAAEQESDLLLAEIRGGSFRLAIPREAEALLWLPPEKAAAVQVKCAALENTFRREMPVTGERLKVTFAPAEAPRRGTVPGPVLDALTLLPDGIFQMDEAIPGQVDTSDNLGEVYLDEDGLRVVTEIRSAQPSLRTYLYQKMERLAALLGGCCQCSVLYPSWEFRLHSPLRQTYSDAYQALCGEPPAMTTVHAGLEVGYFFDKRHDLDAIAIGPNCRDFHSPGETLEISSVKKVYRCLCAALAALGE